MARRGEAGRAIGISLASSAIGGLIGAVLLALGLPLVWPLLMSFGPAETFLLSLLGITFMASLSQSDLLKGLTVGFFGLMLSFVGTDSRLGLPRFTFGQPFLWDGIGIMAAMPAIFAVPELMDLAISPPRSPGQAERANFGYRHLVGRAGRSSAQVADVSHVLPRRAHRCRPRTGRRRRVMVCYGHAVSPRGTRNASATALSKASSHPTPRTTPRKAARFFPLCSSAFLPVRA